MPNVVDDTAQLQSRWFAAKVLVLEVMSIGNAVASVSDLEKEKVAIFIHASNILAFRM